MKWTYIFPRSEDNIPVNFPTHLSFTAAALLRKNKSIFQSDMSEKVGHGFFVVNPSDCLGNQNKNAFYSHETRIAFCTLGPK